MPTVHVGQKAPNFRLPSAQGGELALEDYRGRSNLILLFAKGMACGFCRQKMSQLARGQARFRELGAEILMISPTPLERGRFYAKSFQIPFPYLCDPDYHVSRAYGLTVRRASVVDKAVTMFHAMRMPKPGPTPEFGAAKPTVTEIGRMFNDDDLGFFVIDRAGIVRYARVAAYMMLQGRKPVGIITIPSNDDIVHELTRIEGRGAAARTA